MSASTVIEQTVGLVDEIAQQHAADRQRAYAEYRDLLLRNGSPAKGDAEKLRGLIDSLRLTPDDARRHLAALEEAQRYQAIIAETDESQQRFDEVDRKVKKHQRETGKIVGRRAETQRQLDDERVTALCRVKDIHLSARLLEKLHAGHQELFGVETD